MLIYIRTGIKLQAHPTQLQKKVFSQWTGCARYMWDAKRQKEEELRRILSTEDTYLKIDQAYAHFKSKKATPWLYDLSSVILAIA